MRSRIPMVACSSIFALACGAGAIGCVSDAPPVKGVIGDGGDVLPDAAQDSTLDGTPEASPDATADAADAQLPDPRFGANVAPSGGVRFRVWAPAATGASVVGDFPEADVALASEGSGVWSARVAGAHAGSQYHFRLVTPNGNLTRTDPWCRQLSGAECTVLDPGAYAWKSGPFSRATRGATVVYELHLGSFAVDAGAAAGTFGSTTKKLADLADLGVNAIELMPVHSFSGSKPTGWGYNPQLWLAPRPTLGTADELRALVDESHRLGMGVWLDVVMNHADGWSQAPMRCFDGDCPGGTAGVYFFPSGDYATTPWGPRPDYTRAEPVELLLGSVDQWLAEYRGDGFRWDSVSNIRAIDGAGTTPGGRDLLVEANKRTHSVGALTVAEDLKGYDAITKPSAAGGFGFDAQWDGFGYDVDAVLKGASDDARDLGVIVKVLNGNYNGDPFARLLFTEDHDTVGNGGTRLPDAIDPANPTSWAARKRSILGAVMLLSAPGVPMLFMGQEALATGTFPSNPPPLAAPTATGLKVRAFYRDMIRLRRDLDGAAKGLQETGIEVFHRNDAAKVLAYRRYGASGEDVIVVVNLKNKAYTRYDVGVASAGPWRIRLDTDWTSYGDDFAGGATGSVTAIAGQKDGKPYTLPLKLGAYSAIVVTR
jgi:1,4-alpha-glucan branching enzyme